MEITKLHLNSLDIHNYSRATTPKSQSYVDSHSWTCKIYSQSYVDSDSEGFLKVLLELNNPVQFGVELSFFVEQLISQLPSNLNKMCNRLITCTSTYYIGFSCAVHVHICT